MHCSITLNFMNVAVENFYRESVKGILQSIPNWFKVTY